MRPLETRPRCDESGAIDPQNARTAASRRSVWGVARVLRSDLPHYGVFHVTARGVDGTRIYTVRRDARCFLRRLAHEAARERLDFLALCLMPNHYHFVVAAVRDGLSAALHRLNGAYAQTFNRWYGRKGHLFGDRFWSGVVETDDDIRRTCEYVIANPVRAGLCEHPDEWPWSYSRFGFALE